MKCEGAGDIIVLIWKQEEFGPKLEPTHNLQTPLFWFHTFKRDSVSIKSYSLPDNVPTAEKKLVNTQDCGGEFISRPQVPPTPSWTSHSWSQNVCSKSVKVPVILAPPTLFWGLKKTLHYHSLSIKKITHFQSTMAVDKHSPSERRDLKSSEERESILKFSITDTKSQSFTSSIWEQWLCVWTGGRYGWEQEDSNRQNTEKVRRHLETMWKFSTMKIPWYLEE